MTKTLISHFYNEEYLLPWWLEHHRQYFDHGILIDYASTDNSVEICNRICPNWLVMPSGNTVFQATAVDDEVRHYERQVSGWRMSLNTTEFLMVKDDAMLIDNADQHIQHLMPSISFLDWNPTGSLDNTKYLWNQGITTGISYEPHYAFRRGRSIHNYPESYPLPGRHFYSLPNKDNPMVIFHYANCISSPEMLQRRLQIQHKIPLSDKLIGAGFQHYTGDNGLTVDSLKRVFDKSYYPMQSDCSNYINEYSKT